MQATTGTDAEGRAGAVELTAFVPTLNERANVPLVVQNLEAALAGIRWEVVFVDDDSSDGTAAAAGAIALADRRVRVIRRIGRRGRASACVEGVLSSVAPCFAIMDGGRQQYHEALPEMLIKLRVEDLDLVIGSRRRSNGPTRPGSGRRWLRHWGSRAAGLALHAELADPTSGVFVMARSAFDELVHDLSQQGYTLLLDIFASAGRLLRVAEMPLSSAREDTALDSNAAWELGVLVLDKMVGWLLPVRFVLFALVGTTGLFVHMTVLYTALSGGAGFFVAQTAAVFVAMTWNFFLNNVITYRDRRLIGLAVLRGLLSFYAIYAVGAFANIGVGVLVFDNRQVWWLAGFSGAVIGAVWNFTVSSFIVWRRRGERA